MEFDSIGTNIKLTTAPVSTGIVSNCNLSSGPCAGRGKSVRVDGRDRLQPQAKSEARGANLRSAGFEVQCALTAGRACVITSAPKGRRGDETMGAPPNGLNPNVLSQSNYRMIRWTSGAADTGILKRDSNPPPCSF